MQYCKSIIAVFILQFPLQLFAQDLTGLWRGYMYNDTTQKNYKYEIAISEKKGKLFGYSHTYFIIDNKEYHGVKKVSIKKKNEKIVVEDLELIANNYPIAPPKGVHQLSALVFELRDTVMILSGEFMSTPTKEYHSVTGFIHVERKRNYLQSALVPHLQELGLAKNLSFIEPEKPEQLTTEIAAVAPVAITEPAPFVKVKTDLPAIDKIETKKAEADNEIAKNKIPQVKPENIKIITPPEEPIQAIVNKPAVVSPPAVVKENKPNPVVVVNKPAVVSPPVVVKENKPNPAVVVNKPKEIEKPQPVKVTSAVAATPPSFEKRKVETIESVYYRSDSLEITLYDNGEVDGDTVSVFMNGKMIMNRVGLSTNAVKKIIYTQNTGDSIQIVMYAETLGSLPPNTGLLIVYDGQERYEIRFSGDMQRSSAIVFRKKKE